MTDKMRRQAIKTPRTQKIESSMCRAANSVRPTIGNDVFWTPLELRISESEGILEACRVQRAEQEARRLRERVER
jgi:hypothetical protein